jgi:hypothetical protein
LPVARYKLRARLVSSQSKGINHDPFQLGINRTSTKWCVVDTWIMCSILLY